MVIMFARLGALLGSEGQTLAGRYINHLDIDLTVLLLLAWMNASLLCLAKSNISQL